MSNAPSGSVAIAARLSPAISRSSSRAVGAPARRMRIVTEAYGRRRSSRGRQGVPTARREAQARASPASLWNGWRPSFAACSCCSSSSSSRPSPSSCCSAARPPTRRSCRARAPTTTRSPTRSGREDAFAAAAARGHAHVIYAKSPGGARASAERVARYRPLVEAAAAGGRHRARHARGAGPARERRAARRDRRPAARGGGRAHPDPRRDGPQPAGDAGRPGGRAADRALAAAGRAARATAR